MERRGNGMINDARVAWLPTRYITAAMSPFLRRIEPLGRASEGEVNISCDNMRTSGGAAFCGLSRQSGAEEDPRHNLKS